MLPLKTHSINILAMQVYVCVNQRSSTNALCVELSCIQTAYNIHMTFIDIYLYVDMHDVHHMYTIINRTIIMNISVNNDIYIKYTCL